MYVFVFLGALALFLLHPNLIEILSAFSGQQERHDQKERGRQGRPLFRLHLDVGMQVASDEIWGEVAWLSAVSVFYLRICADVQ